MKKFQPWLLVVFAGLLTFLGYVGYNQYYLNWFFLVPLFWALRHASPGRAFLLGWTAGLVGHAGGFYWLIHMLSVFGGLNKILSILGLLAFAAFNGLSFAIFSWMIRRVMIYRPTFLWWAAPVTWTGIEHVFPFIFPNYIGASQYPLLLFTQIADITGVLGISFLLIWLNTTLHSLLSSVIERRPPSFKPLLLFVVVLCLTATYGKVRISATDKTVKASPKIKVALIQTGLGATDKYFAPNRFIAVHEEMTKSVSHDPINPEPDLIIWPEAVIDWSIYRRWEYLPLGYIDEIDTPLLFGAITSDKKDESGSIYTSALLIDPNRKIQGIYDKQILVPLGEYVPFGDIFPILYQLLPYTSHFHPGTRPDPFPFGKFQISLNICYEDLFSGLIRHNMTAYLDAGQPLPHAIFNLTNDSWYGDTVEPMQHLVLASFRAIEHRRALIRSTNTGISAVIDPVGRINKRTRQWTSAILRDEVPMMEGRTLFNLAGNWLGWTTLLLTLVGQGMLMFKKKTAMQ